MAIQIKTPEEIELMRKGGKILKEVLEETCRRAKAGVSTLELDQFAEDFIRKHDALPSFKGYRGFPATLCTSKNETIVHGIPKKEDILKDGDLLTIDCGVLYKGLHVDAARTVGIGEISPAKRRLMETAYTVLDEAMNLLKPYIHLNEIGALIEKLVKKAGYHVIHDLTGHGVGRKLHEEPVILNYWEGNPGPLLKPGMTLAIEPIFSIGTSKMKQLKDGWTLVTVDNSPAVQVEHTVLITEDGHEILA